MRLSLLIGMVLTLALGVAACGGPTATPTTTATGRLPTGPTATTALTVAATTVGPTAPAAPTEGSTAPAAETTDQSSQFFQQLSQFKDAELHRAPGTVAGPASSGTIA